MKENHKLWAFLIGIFFLAFALRIFIFQFDHLFEYDAYFHTRMTWDIVQQGVVNNPDVLAYYQEGGAPQTFTNLYWVITATLYNVLVVPIFGLDKFIFTKFAQILPAFWGALIAVTCFFVGKTATDDKRIGYVMAFMAAITPAFIYRTMSGAQGDNSFGFLPFSVGLMFFLMAIKEEVMTKKSIALSVLAGVAFFVMVLSWNMYPLIFIVLLPTILFTIFYKINEGQELLAYIVHAGIPFIMYLAATVFVGENIINLVASFAGIGPQYLLLALTISIGVIAFFYVFVKKYNKTVPISNKSMCTLVFLLFVAVLLVVLANVTDIADRTTLGSLVGEESIGNQFFFSKFNFFLFMPILAIMLTPFVLYFKKEILERPQLMMFFMVVFTTFIMGWYKLKFSFALGYGMIFALGLLAFFVLTLIKKNGLEEKIVGIVTLSILVMYIFAGGIFIVDYVPHVDTQPDYIEMIDWIKTNTPEDAKLFNDWGSGHILSYETGRGVSADNRNYSALANALYGEFMVTEDINRGYEIITEDIGADYVILDLSGINSLAGHTYYMHNVINPALIQQYYVGRNEVIGCTVGDVYVCGGNQIPSADFFNIPSVINDVVYDFSNGRDPQYLVRHRNNLVLLNQAVNNSNYAHVFFGSEETDGLYELAFDSSSFRIYKVIK